MTNDALDLLYALRLEDGRRWGDAAVDFQREDAAHVLAVDSPTPYSFLTRSRGGSKTADEAGVATVAMLAQLAPGSRLYGLAADRDQGRLLVDSIAGYAARTPELQNALRIDAYRVTAIRTGSVFEVLAADAPGAWGLRPDFVVIDELAMWPDTPSAHGLWDAVTSAAAKSKGCRMVLLTSAGDPAHWSRRVLDHALADPLWRVNEVRGPAPWLDPAKLAEQRRRLPESVYQRLFENRWVSGEDRLVAAEDLAACVTLDGPQKPRPGLRYIVGVDVGLRHDRTVCCICHLERGVVWLDRIAVWSGSKLVPVKLGEVEAWLAQAVRDYRASIVLDPWQAAQLTERLRRRGVNVREYPFSAQSVGRLASTMYLLLRERSLRLPDDPELLDELANVRLRETSPGVMRMDHDSGRHDDRAIALALAAHRLVERGEPSGRSRSVVPRGKLSSRPPRRRGSTVPLAAIPTRKVDALDQIVAAAGVVSHDRDSELANHLRGGRL